MEMPTRFQITLLNTGETFSCGPATHVLKAMTQLGIRGVPSGCHGGGCGVCKVRVMKGDYRVEAMSRAHISEDEEAQGIVLACRLYPLSNLDLSVTGKLVKAVEKQKKFGLV